jgi:hypothetical protein
MGDRCYMTVYVAREYVHLFKDLFLEDMGEGSPAVARLFEEEANYAYNIGCGSDGFGLLPKGIPYYGEHGAGGDYAECSFATTGDEMRCVPSLHGDPVAHIERNGRPSAADLREIMKYYEAYDTVAAQHKELKEAHAAKPQ